MDYETKEHARRLHFNTGELFALDSTILYPSILYRTIFNFILFNSIVLYAVYNFTLYHTIPCHTVFHAKLCCAVLCCAISYYVSPSIITSARLIMLCQPSQQCQLLEYKWYNIFSKLNFKTTPLGHVCCTPSSGQVQRTFSRIQLGPQD